MMPNLDGFGLLAALQADPATTGVPVIMLSARAGEEGTIEGLEAGADDYLIKPFAARELLARVHANLELDRVAPHARRAAPQPGPARPGAAARAGRQLGARPRDRRDHRLGRADAPDAARRADELRRAAASRRRSLERVHPDDVAPIRAALAAAADGRAAGPRDARRRRRTASCAGTACSASSSATPTARRSACAAASRTSPTSARPSRRWPPPRAEREAARPRAPDRRRAPAQPAPRAARSTPTSSRSRPSTQPGVAGTQVGGDWYDVIELGAGRTALVIGDVMGRGVRAAAVMGQLRAAVRAYARLDLAPADVLEFLDGVVRELGEVQIVTCIYAVYDPHDRTLTYANAGHLPPLLAIAGRAGAAADRARPARRWAPGR